MRSRYKVFDNNLLYFVTSTTVGWIPVFTSEKYYNILINTLKFYRRKNKLEIFAYVLLPDHFHLIIKSDDVKYVMKLIKMYSAREIIKCLKEEQKTEILREFQLNKKNYKKNSHYQIWQEGYLPKEITNENVFKQKLNYIHYNPVKRRLISDATEWRYSSASFYEKGIQGVIDIDIIY